MNTVKSRILIRNGYSLHDKQVIDYIPCGDQTEVSGVEWLVPVIERGRFTGYRRTIALARPQVDAVKTIRIKLHTSNQDIWIPIADNVGIEAFTNNCKKCCGEPNDMPDVVIPNIIIEDYPCPTVEPGDESYKFFAIYPANPDGNNYSLAGSFNGEPGTPTPPSAGFASVAATVAWAIANWAAYGTFSNEALGGGGTKLNLVSDESTGTISAGIQIGLVAKKYCLEFPEDPEMVDRIVIGTTPVETTFPATLLDNDNPEAVLMQLAAIMGAEKLTIVDIAGVNHIQYEGIMKPIKLMYGEDDVVSWTVGVCA